MITNVFLLTLEIILVPFLIGALYHRLTNNPIEKVLENWIHGFVICLAILQVLVLPCIFLDINLTILTMVYVGILVMLSLASLFVIRNHIKEMGKVVVKMIKSMPWQAVLLVGIVVCQMYMYVEYKHTDHDDSFYVATAVTAVSTDSVFQIDPYTGNTYEILPVRYVLSPFPIFTAILSKISGIHGTILAHTVLPVFYLLLAYGVYALIGTKLFDGNRKNNVMFCFFIALISMYLQTSIYTQSTFMLTRIWQGKAFLAAFLLPYIFYLGYRLMTEGWKKGEWIAALAAMLACCLATSMGIILGAVLMGIMGIMAAFVHKDIKILIKPALCCVPNIALALAYLLMRG